MTNCEICREEWINIKYQRMSHCGFSIGGWGEVNGEKESLTVWQRRQLLLPLWVACGWQLLFNHLLKCFSSTRNWLYSSPFYFLIRSENLPSLKSKIPKDSSLFLKFANIQILSSCSNYTFLEWWFLAMLYIQLD